MANLKWHKYPAETPAKDESANGEYLVRGIGSVTKKLHYFVCLWVWCKDMTDIRGFFYNGNEFYGQCENDEFEWISVKGL